MNSSPAPLQIGHAAPVEEGSRLVSIDIARGFALLGIFLVNIQFFAMPMGKSQEFAPGDGEGPLSAFLFFLVKCLCEWKVYGLFSLLFGIGFALQQRRAIERTGRFSWLFVRRLLVLMVFGLLHGLLLWYGDILLTYALAGFVLLLVGLLHGETLAKVGVGVVLVAALLMTTCLGGSVAMNSLNVQTATAPPTSIGAAHSVTYSETYIGQPEPPESAAPDAAPDTDTGTAHDTASHSSPSRRLFKGMQSGTMRGPTDPKWIEAEIEAYRDGPYSQAFIFRAWTWFFMMMMVVFSFGWGVIGLFMVGASLVKTGRLESDDTTPFRKLLLLGACLGLPLCTVGVLLAAYGGLPGLLGGVLLNTLGSPMMSLGYLSLCIIVAKKGLFSKALGLVANTGRMALTNYLSQTVIATFVFYHWGLQQFALWSREERFLLVIGVWAAQVAFSTLWLKFFRFGPMEWLWRSLTYLAPQKLLR